MAIPTGTTARQLGIPARWLPVAVVTLGLLTWWWPGYRAWGAMSAGLILSLTLWLLWRIVAGDRTVPGHGIHWAVAAPAVVVLYHLLRLSWDEQAATAGLSGAMSVTLLFQLGLLALGVLLVQSVFLNYSRPVFLPLLCSVAVCFGASAALLWTPQDLPRGSVSLLACAGAIAVLGALVPVIERTHDGQSPRGWPGKVLLGGCGALVIAALLIAGGASRRALFVTVLMLGASMLLGMVRGRRMRILWVCVVLAGLSAVLVFLGVRAWGHEDSARMLLGRGEEAVIEAAVDAAGLNLLVETAGAPVVAVMLAATAAAGGLGLLSRPGDRSARVRASCWTAAAGLSVAALLSEGGLFLPAVTLAAAMFWGLLPAMCEAPARRRSGVWLAVVMVALMLLLGLVPNPGLVSWSASALGGSSATLHLIVGFLLSLVLVWTLGVRSVKLGLLGVVLAVFAGGLGELLQSFAPGRGTPIDVWLAVLGGEATAGQRAMVASELNDWFMHSLGAVMVVVPYLLAMGSRWCESPDAPPRGVGKPISRPSSLDSRGRPPS